MYELHVTNSEGVHHSDNGIVIVGGGLAAARTAEQLRRSEYTGPITIVSDEVHLPYDRPPLSKEVLRKEVDDVALKPREFYDENDITLRLGSAATRLDTAAQTVTLDDGTVLGYDELVIATGLVPRRIPAFPIWTAFGCCGRSTKAWRCASTHRPRSTPWSSAPDSSAVRWRPACAASGWTSCWSSRSRPAGRGARRADRRAGGAAASRRRCRRAHRRRGGRGTRQGHVDTVVLTDGTELTADLVVVGIGSRPATEWLDGSGIEVDNGVICDEAGRTSAPNVWALGDVASWRDPTGHQARVEHWSNVADQARVVVPAMLGQDVPSNVVVPYFWSDQYDVKIQCLGEPHATDIVHLVEDDGRKFLAYYERDGVLVGVVGGGMPGKVMKVRAKIAAGVPISEMLNPA